MGGWRWPPPLPTDRSELNHHLLKLSNAFALSPSSMATATRRPVLSLTPRGVSLEEWESKAPLREDELHSVGRVKDTCLDRRLPQKVSAPSPRMVQGAERGRALQLVKQGPRGVAQRTSWQAAGGGA